MFLSEIYTPEFIKVGLEATDKEEVFEELVEHFCQIASSRAREEMLSALYTREAKMSTGIEAGIAVPHGKTDAVDRVRGVVGISKEGIDYEALDGKPVHLLFMMLAPQSEAGQHLKMLQELADLLKNPAFYTEILAQSDGRGVWEIIRKHEGILSAIE
jgi:PTS system fructose-specific IIC component/PTS system nitrogen regulatory IIA component